MLMKRKRPQKKVVVKKTEWLEKPVDQECQEGKIDKITFSARLSEKEKRGKWYLGNNVSNTEIHCLKQFVNFYFFMIRTYLTFYVYFFCRELLTM